MLFSCAANELCRELAPVPTRKFVDVSVVLVAVSVTLKLPVAGVEPKSPIVHPVRKVPRFTLRFDVGAVSELHAPLPPAPPHPVQVPVTVRFPLIVTGVLNVWPVPDSSSIQLLLVPPELLGNAPTYQSN